MIHEIAQNSKHALRLWARQPAQTAIAIVALAIGIGASTGIFSVVNALVLSSLPFRNPSRLAAIHTYLVPHDSAGQFDAWRHESTYLSDAALFEPKDVNLGSQGRAWRARLTLVSGNFFSVLGTLPALGRQFSVESGNTATVILGYGVWQQLFAGNPQVIGSRVRVDGAPLTVIGVMPPGFDYPDRAQLWQPGEFRSGNNGWEVIARLKPDVNWAQARAAFAADVRHLAPKPYEPNANDPDTIRSARDQLAGPAKTASLLLMMAVALILLLACIHVANLLLARTTDRLPEFSIRSAMGASRARLARQLFTESLLLASVAALLGFAVAFWTASLASKFEPPPLSAQAYSILDGRVLAFNFGVAILSSLLFGLLPAWNAGHIHRFSNRGSTGKRQSRLVRELLVAAQITLTVVLLAASLSVGRAFVHLMQTDRGFGLRGLVTAGVSIEGTAHQADGRSLAYFEQVLARLRRLPGVQSASATEFLPLNSPGFLGGRMTLDGTALAQHASMIVPVLGRYFQTMSARLIYGREFSDAEVHADARIAVVNQTFASQFGRPQNAIGHRVAIGGEPPWRIVGVVKNMDYMSPDANSMQLFIPAHSPGSMYSTFVVHVRGSGKDSLAMVRDAIQSVDPTVPVFGVKTMQTRMDEALSRPNFYRTTLLFFGAAALLLAVIGIFGVVSYAVARRTREMGIRLALGAPASRLRARLLSQELLVVSLGIAAGLFVSVFTGRLLAHLVTGSPSADILSLALTTLLVCSVAALSIWSATAPISRLEILAILAAE